MAKSGEEGVRACRERALVGKLWKPTLSAFDRLCLIGVQLHGDRWIKHLYFGRVNEVAEENDGMTVAVDAVHCVTSRMTWSSDRAHALKNLVSSIESCYAT